MASWWGGIPPVVLLYVAIAATANALFGFELSVISAAKLDFAAEFDIATTSIEYGFLASALPVGATLGCPVAGTLQDWVGRRVSLILASAIYLGGASVSYASTGFWMLSAGRITTGVAVGMFSSTGPMYIAELSPPAIRGKLVTFNQVCCVVGVLLGFVTDKLLSPRWRLMFVAATPLAAVLLLCFTFVTPFSPRWLMTKGREAEARAVLRRIRGGGGGGAAAASSKRAPPEDAHLLRLLQPGGHDEKADEAAADVMVEADPTLVWAMMM